MAFLNEEFNVNELPVGNNNFEPLPAGWYSATISQSELKDTKAGNGQYIKLRYDITGPTHQGRVVLAISTSRIRTRKPRKSVDNSLATSCVPSVWPRSLTPIN
jgi:hypothetical protein